MMYRSTKSSHDNKYKRTHEHNNDCKNQVLIVSSERPITLPTT